MLRTDRGYYRAAATTITLENKVGIIDIEGTCRRFILCSADHARGSSWLDRQILVLFYGTIGIVFDRVGLTAYPHHRTGRQTGHSQGSPLHT